METERGASEVSPPTIPRQMAYVLMAFEFGQIWQRLRPPPLSVPPSLLPASSTLRARCHFACFACPQMVPQAAVAASEGMR